MKVGLDFIDKGKIVAENPIMFVKAENNNFPGECYKQIKIQEKPKLQIKLFSIYQKK